MKRLKSEPEPHPGWSKERRYQRVGCDLSARFFYRDRWHKAKLTTLSAGGAFVACAFQIKTDQVIWVEFEVEGASVSALSRVVWNTGTGRGEHQKLNPRGFAVEFESMETRDRVWVNRFVVRSLRILRALNYELNQPEPDEDKIRNLFLSLRPGDSLRINHIRKVVQDEFRHFRLRKIGYGK